MRSKFRHKLIIGSLGLALVWVFGGCAQVRDLRERVMPTKEAKAGDYEHRVKWPGETLSIIAKWYTDKFENWKAIAKANPKIDPQRIFIGQRIRIPGKLLKTRKPMPKSFLKNPGSKNKAVSSPSRPKPPPQREEEEPKLFGPKPYPQK